MDSRELRILQEAYLNVYYDLDEGTAGDVAARAKKLANQRKGQTPKRKAIYNRLANLASERENPSPSGRDLNNRTGMTADFRRTRRGQSDWNIEHDKPGGITKNPKKLRKQKALGEFGESYDIYDIILSHLLDEGYADCLGSAEIILENMSDEWWEEIVEANVGDQYATRGMSPDDAVKYKQNRRNTQYVNNKPKAMRNYWGGYSPSELNDIRSKETSKVRAKKKPLARSAGYNPETGTRDINKVPMGKYGIMLDKKRNPERHKGYYG